MVASVILYDGDGSNELFVDSNQMVNLSGMSQVSLSFSQTEIKIIKYDGEKLQIELLSGEEVVFESVVDENGVLVPVIDNDNNVLFSDIGELLSLLEETAAGSQQDIVSDIIDSANYNIDEAFVGPLDGGVDLSAQALRDAQSGVGSVVTAPNNIDNIHQSSNADGVFTQESVSLVPSIANVFVTEVVDVSDGALKATTFSSQTEGDSYIQGHGEIISEIDVSGVSSITDLNVILDFAIYGVADVVVSLISPNGTEVELIQWDQHENRPMRFLDNLEFNDDISNSAENVFIEDSQHPYILVSENTLFRPLEGVSAFDGQNPEGKWTLSISSSASSNLLAAGELNALQKYTDWNGDFTGWGIEFNGEVDQVAYSGNLEVTNIASSDVVFHEVEGTLKSDNAKIKNLSVKLDEDGSYSVSGDFSALNDSETAAITFEYYATVGGEDSESATVSLTVTGSKYVVDSDGVLSLGADDLVMDFESLQANTNLSNQVTKIDLSDGSEHQLLGLEAQDVLDLSKNDNVLVIEGGSSDHVSILGSWAKAENITDEGVVYNVYHQGDATLHIDVNVDTEITLI